MRILPIVPLILCICIVCTACAGAEQEASAVDTLRSFIELMDESATDSDSLRAAYELLDGGARDALRARATKARTLSGRTYQPWQMLAQGRFRLRFAPAAHGGMRAVVDGDNALVAVRDSGGELRAKVPMVRESGHWRVSLAIPPMSDVSSPERSADP